MTSDYTKQIWHDNDISTPVSADRLTYLEDGIGDHDHPDIVLIPGPQGEPGPPGGSLLSAFWQFPTQTAAPPGNGQVRADTGMTTLWISETDADGFVRDTALGSIQSGEQILLRGANGSVMDLTITAPPTDEGTYWTIPVTVTSGSFSRGTKTQVSFVLSSGGGVPSSGVAAHQVADVDGAFGDAYLAFTTGFQAGTDLTIDANGNLAVNTDGLYVVQFDLHLTTGGAATGIFQMHCDASLGSSTPDDAYLSLGTGYVGDVSFIAGDSIKTTIGFTDHLTTGNILAFDAQYRGQGSVTSMGGDTMLWARRIA